jgi:streptogramin lyase
VVALGGQAWDVHTAGAVWVSDRTGNRVLRLDPRTGKITGRILLQYSLSGLGVTADGVWVANDTKGIASRIDPRRIG